MNQPYQSGITLHNSSQIKAIALLMMVYHHFFGFPEKILINNPFFETVLSGHYTQSI